jgi:hypothetical protein
VFSNAPNAFSFANDQIMQRKQRKHFIDTTDPKVYSTSVQTRFLLTCFGEYLNFCFKMINGAFFTTFSEMLKNSKHKLIDEKVKSIQVEIKHTAVVNEVVRFFGNIDYNTLNQPGACVKYGTDSSNLDIYF